MLDRLRGREGQKMLAGSVSGGEDVLEDKVESALDLLQL